MSSTKSIGSRDESGGAVKRPNPNREFKLEDLDPANIAKFEADVNKNYNQPYAYDWLSNITQDAQWQYDIAMKRLA